MLKGLVDALSNPHTVECCEFCDRPLLDDKAYADLETADAGLGIALCTRQSCIDERESMPVLQRLNVYLGHAAIGRLTEHIS
ncbi:MAG: hypothetical protein PVH21_00050 [Myxococcales bacterium]|jgi:hypothetical protein